MRTEIEIAYDRIDALEQRIASVEAENTNLRTQLALKQWPTKYDELMCDPEFRDAYGKEWARTDKDNAEQQLANDVACSMASLLSVSQISVIQRDVERRVAARAAQPGKENQ